MTVHTETRQRVNENGRVVIPASFRKALAETPRRASSTPCPEACEARYVPRRRVDCRTARGGSE